MLHKIRICLLVFGCLVGVSSLASIVPTPGSPAPQFQLKSQDGSSISLSQYRGKWVVLYFDSSESPSECTARARSFRRDQAKYAAANSIVLGVNIGSTRVKDPECAAVGRGFKLLEDVTHNVARSYGSITISQGEERVLRNTFIINPSGVIVGEFLNYSTEHVSEQVLESLGALQRMSRDRMI